MLFCWPSFVAVRSLCGLCVSFELSYKLMYLSVVLAWKQPVGVVVAATAAASVVAATCWLLIVDWRTVLFTTSHWRLYLSKANHPSRIGRDLVIELGSPYLLFDSLSPGWFRFVDENQVEVNSCDKCRIGFFFFHETIQPFNMKIFPPQINGTLVRFKVFSRTSHTYPSIPSFFFNILKKPYFGISISCFVVFFVHALKCFLFQLWFLFYFQFEKCHKSLQADMPGWCDVLLTNPIRDVKNL